ncbi:MAG TPA: argininosuccinate lyase [Candidatus Binatia bacterium]|nr:argininosuccinate lyase [Candidatus Binatia bacterium]
MTAEAPGGRRGAVKVWAGRLGGETSRRLEEYTQSLGVDRRLAAEDIQGSLAHAEMLRQVGLLSEFDHRAIRSGLLTIRDELDRGGFVEDQADEDIHTAVERRLHELIGPPAGRLHTGRSRNDQVATDLRLWCRRRAGELILACADLQEALIRRAREHRAAPMPGYTHGQRAQVVSLAHHLLAYVEMLQRDVERLEGARRRCDRLPLGSGALAGTTLPIDRDIARRALGFQALSANSLDAVSDRDFAVELVFACALLMLHLSRFAEEVVLWTGAEWGFAELPDTHATGSSLMPQKKNPDVLELVRARSGRTAGDLVSLLAVLKGLPLAYDRDLQEDKRPLFDAVDTALASLAILAEIVSVLRFDVAAMRRAASDPMLQATDVAEHLVARGLAFREAHRLVGAAVQRCLAQGRSLADLGLEEWRAISDRFDESVLGLFDVDAALRRRELPGGPGPRAVSRALARATAMVARTRRSELRSSGSGRQAGVKPPAPPGS